MASRACKIAVLVAVLAILALLELRTVEAQVTSCNLCASHASCYKNSLTGSSYYCVCRHGYKGNGYTGSGNSGCKKRHLRAWKIIVSIIGAIVGALLLLCLCLFCLKRCLTRRRRSRGPMVQQPGGPAYTQQTYPPQDGVPMYEANPQYKVPGPTGVV